VQATLLSSRLSSAHRQSTFTTLY